MSRILQIIGDGSPGGGTTAVLTLTQLLSEQMKEITLATQEGSYLAKEARANGLTVVGLDFSRRSSTGHLAFQLGRLFQDCDPSVVHAHGARAALPIALASIAIPLHLVYTVHGFHFQHKNPVSRQLARAAEAFCISRADCTVFVSDGDREIATASGLLGRARAYRIIKNAVCLGATSAPLRGSYDIGFVGRLHPQKNPLILVDILKMMRPMRPTLCIIGGGELACELQSRMLREGLDEQVTFHGECDRREALQALSSCRTLILPSRWEGHPIILIEAMHLGVPVVVSNIPGSDEIVRHGQTGFLVPADNAGGYAECLTRLLGDDALRAQLAAAAREIAHIEYSPVRLLNSYLEVYDAASCGAAVALGMPT